MRVIILLLLSPLVVSAKSFTLIDDATKETYVCNSVAAATSTVTVTATSGHTDCLEKVAKLCHERGAMSEAACAELAGRRCKDKSAEYADCAQKTTQACIDSASGSGPTCLDRSLRECK